MKKIVFAFGVMLAPLAVFAQVGQPVTNVSALVAWIGSAFNIATTLILGAAVVYFLWNVFGFVMSAGDSEKRAEKQGGIVYGIIGIAVMVSVWGLVRFFTSSARLETTPITPPAAIELKI